MICNEVGGTHYSSMKYQPLEFILKMELNFIQGSVVKYVSRYKNKNGREDLLKAISLCDTGIKYDGVKRSHSANTARQECDEYCKLNKFDKNLFLIIMYVVVKDYHRAKNFILELVNDLDEEK